METFLDAAAALAAPIGVGLLFWVAIRALVNADRNERLAMARLEAEEDARAARTRAPERAGAGGSAPARPAAAGADDRPAGERRPDAS